MKCLRRKERPGGLEDFNHTGAYLSCWYTKFIRSDIPGAQRELAQALPLLP